MAFRHYIAEVLEPSLLFGIFPGFLGIAAARYYGILNIWTALLAVLGVVLAQIAVNLIDDYTDYASGLDKETSKTKFSGGSMLVTEGLVDVRKVLAIGLISFLAALGIGAYLVWSKAVLLPFVVVGAASVLLYAKYLSKVPYLSEPINAINFALVSLGVFIAGGGRIADLGMLAFASLASGIQGGAAIVANYVPDMKADRKYGRRSGVVMIGDKRIVAVYYLAIESVAYSSVIAGVLLRMIPAATLLILLSAPLAVAVACKIARYRNAKAYERTMALATAMELGIMLILALSFL